MTSSLHQNEAYLARLAQCTTSVVKKRQFSVLISVVKKGQFWVVITTVKKGQFWVVISVVK